MSLIPLKVIRNSVLTDPRFELIRWRILTALKYRRGSYNQPRLTGSLSPRVEIKLC